MNDRVRQLRKSLDLNQADFGKRLGISRDAVANMEGKGRAEIKDNMILLICREFGVNEAWLKTGEGEMFLPESIEKDLAELTVDLFTNESASFKRELISKLARMSDDEWIMLEKMIDLISKKE